MTASGQHPSGLGTDVPDQDHDVSAALGVPSFRRFWPAIAGSWAGDWLGLVATAALAGALAGPSYAKAGLAVAVVLLLRVAPALVLGPVIGAIADRAPRKAVLAGTDVLRAVLLASLPLIGTLTWVFVATAAIEVLALAQRRAEQVTIAGLVPAERLEAAGRVLLTTRYGPAPVAALAFSLLALFGGVLQNGFDALRTHPLHLAFYAAALLLLGSGLIVARVPIPKREPGRAPAQESVLGAVLSGWTYIGSAPVVRGLVIGMLGAVAAAGLVIGLALVYVQDLGAGRPGFGALIAAVLLGLALGLRSGPRVLAGFSRHRLFGLAVIAAGGFLAVMALIPNMVMACLLAVGVGTCCGIAWTTGHALLERTVDAQVHDRTLAFLAPAARLVLVAVLVIGAGLAGVIGRHTIGFTDSRSLAYNGAAFAFLIAAVLVLATGVATYRRLDDRPGTRLSQDLKAAWSARPDRPVRAARGLRTGSGVFVAIEGGDGTGKSTQARLLADWLRSDQGHDVVLTREPGATPAGVRLREVLLNNASDLGSRAEALLFAADRAHHVEAVVRPALERGAVVVTDRYIDSSVAYQGAGRELDGTEVARISRWATDDLVPDLTVLLDVDPVIGKARRARDLARSGEDRLESQAEDFHERVRAGFLALARQAPHRYLVVDAGLSADEVQQLIRDRVRQTLPVSARRRAELDTRLAEEDQTRERRAAAEAEVLRMDADLRRRRVEEAREREESRRRARDEAERQLQEEAERELRSQESRRNREEVDRRASAAAAAATLGPVTEPVRMPVRRPEPEQQFQPEFQPEFQGETNPVPQAAQPQQPAPASPDPAPQTPSIHQTPQSSQASPAWPTPPAGQAFPAPQTYSVPPTTQAPRSQQAPHDQQASPTWPTAPAGQGFPAPQGSPTPQVPTPSPAPPARQGSPEPQAYPAPQAPPTPPARQAPPSRQASQASSIHQAPPVPQAAPTRQNPPTHQAPSIHQVSPVHQAPPAPQAAPTRQTPPSRQDPHIPEAPPAHQAAPSSQAAPTRQAPPSRQGPPAPQAAPARQTRPAPQPEFRERPVQEAPVSPSSVRVPVAPPQTIQLPEIDERESDRTIVLPDGDPSQVPTAADGTPGAPLGRRRGRREA